MDPKQDKDKKEEPAKDTPEFSHQEIEGKSLEELMADDKGDDWDDAEKKAKETGVNDDGTPKDNADKKDDKAADDKSTGAGDKEPADDKQENKDKNEDAEHLKSLNPDELKQQISDEVAQKVVKALSGGEDKTAKEEEELKKLLEGAPWVKENRNPTYNEVIQWTLKTSTPLIKQQIMDDFKKEAEDEEKREVEAKQQQEATQKQVDKEWSDYWANQLTDLEEAGKIPPLKNADGTENQKAKDVRLKLFKTMKEISVKRVAEGKPAITNLKEVFYEHFKDDSEVPGGDAPINGAHRTTNPNDPKSFDYNEVHGSSFEDILSGRG